MRIATYSWIAALGFTVAGCSLLTDMGDLTFADAASASASAAGGTSTASSGGGPNGGAGGCTPMVPRQAKRVFVSSRTYKGNLAHLGLGDAYQDAAAECASMAEDACLGGTWKAWLSADGNQPAGDYRLSVGPIVNMDGVPVADSFSTLFGAGQLQAPIDRDEYNIQVSSVIVWTGTNAYGQGLPSRCGVIGDWTSAEPSEQGIVGRVTEVGPAWSNDARPMDCDQSGRLYCFEQ